ncbi:unnamed protein product [Parnassius apollo]|uniref:(apollo) hypothetical protein n=1 Tax=Parnassius apollo TaxID=110799 RepID=A0A8S3Y7R2_PARAO|nr:unnamed protein product [Parnassius apollo]
MLSKVIQICQAAEISKEESLCIDSNEAESGQVDAVQGNRRGARGWRSGRGRTQTASTSRGGRAVGAAQAAPAAAEPCVRCGCVRCAGGYKCPARQARCFVCDKKVIFHGCVNKRV